MAVDAGEKPGRGNGQQIEKLHLEEELKLVSVEGGGRGCRLFLLKAAFVRARPNPATQPIKTFVPAAWALCRVVAVFVSERASVHVTVAILWPF